MTLNEYLEKFAEIHDKMWNTVEPEEIQELSTEHINLMEKMLREHYWYIRPQERD